jgi:hypothetical protein
MTTISDLFDRGNTRNRGPGPVKTNPITVPVLVEGDVDFAQFMRLAQSLGCRIRYDDSLCAVVIMPGVDTPDV